MILATICNRGNDECLALIDPFKEKTKIIKIGWDEVGGATGISKIQGGYAIGVQLLDVPKSGLIIYDNELNEINRFYLEGVQDIHGMMWHSGKLYCASTRNNSIYTIEFKEGKMIETLYRKVDDEDYDSIHLNSITYRKGLVVSSFCKRKEDELWHECKRPGRVFYVDSGMAIDDNVHHPHTLKIYNKNVIWCESGRGRVETGQFEILIDGYVRGMTWDRDFFYVGCSNSREMSRSTGKKITSQFTSFCSIFVFFRNNGELFKEIPLPFGEIYYLERR